MLYYSIACCHDKRKNKYRRTEPSVFTVALVNFMVFIVTIYFGSVVVFGRWGDIIIKTWYPILRTYYITSESSQEQHKPTHQLLTNAQPSFIRVTWCLSTSEYALLVVAPNFNMEVHSIFKNKHIIRFRDGPRISLWKLDLEGSNATHGFRTFDVVFCSS